MKYRLIILNNGLFFLIWCFMGKIKKQKQCQTRLINLFLKNHYIDGNVTNLLKMFFSSKGSRYID